MSIELCGDKRQAEKGKREIADDGNNFLSAFFTKQITSGHGKVQTMRLKPFQVVQSFTAKLQQEN